MTVPGVIFEDQLNFLEALAVSPGFNPNTLLIEDVPADLQAKTEEAARLCPRQAITLEK